MSSRARPRRKTRNWHSIDSILAVTTLAATKARMNVNAAARFKRSDAVLLHSVRKTTLDAAVLSVGTGWRDGDFLVSWVDRGQPWFENSWVDGEQLTLNPTPPPNTLQAGDRVRDLLLGIHLGIDATVVDTDGLLVRIEFDGSEARTAWQPVWTLVPTLTRRDARYTIGAAVRFWTDDPSPEFVQDSFLTASLFVGDGDPGSPFATRNLAGSVGRIFQKTLGGRFIGVELPDGTRLGQCRLSEWAPMIAIVPDLESGRA